MKKSIFLIALFFTATILSAQTTIQWEKSFGGTADDIPLEIIPTPDEGYLVGSRSNSINGDVSGNHGLDDLWLLKLSPDGTKQWQKCLGSTGTDILAGLDNVASGGYIAVGYTYSNGQKSSSQVYGNHGDQDIWVVKVDASGNLEWRKCYGGCDKDETRDIIQTSDGNFVIAGSTLSFNTGDVYGSHGDWDAWVIKIAPDGELIWQKTLGGSGIDYLYAIAETTNGNLVVSGLSSSVDGDLSGANTHGKEDYWVAQLNPDGQLMWNKTYGGSEYDGVRGMSLDENGGILLTGACYSSNGDVGNHFGSSDAWVLSLDASGQILWERAYGGSGNDFGFRIFQRTDHRFILVAETNSGDGDVIGNHGDREAWILKMDNTGNILDQRCLGGSNTDFVRSAMLGQTNEIILGATSSSSDGDVSQNHGASDAWIIKLNVPLGLKPEAPNAAAMELKLSPNPATETIQVQTNVSGIKQLELYNESGQLLQSVKMDQTEIELPIHTLPSGNYLIKINTKTGHLLSTSFVKM